MFITKSQLSSYHRGFSIANEYVAPIQAKASATYSFEADATVFLSHSHRDKGLIEPAVAFLRSQGGKCPLLILLQPAQNQSDPAVEACEAFEGGMVNIFEFAEFARPLASTNLAGCMRRHTV